jgi:uncharacterized membrane protein (UPF0127 family)
MEIINISKKQTLANEVVISNSFLSRLKGLLGYKSIRKDMAMLLRPANSIHTFFMRFPIDVIFVDKDNVIIRIFSDMKPFRATGIYPASCFVVELPGGTVNSTQTAIGDSLQIR